jgi:hypothetical protein
MLLASRGGAWTWCAGGHARKRNKAAGRVVGRRLCQARWMPR